MTKTTVRGIKEQVQSIRDSYLQGSNRAVLGYSLDALVLQVEQFEKELLEELRVIQAKTPQATGEWLTLYGAKVSLYHRVLGIVPQPLNLTRQTKEGEQE